jgi:hypothetical protein
MNSGKEAVAVTWHLGLPVVNISRRLQFDARF